jgi:hypothetical protein
MSLLPIAGGTLNLSGTISAEDITSVVVNIKTGAISEYANFDFNSMAKIGGKYFGLKSDRLLELTGGTDEGVEIDSAFLTGITDLPNEGQYGSPKDALSEKSIPNAYAVMRTFGNGGSLRLRIDQVKDRLYYNQGSPSTTLGIRNVPFRPAKGLKGRFWQFGYENVDGEDFEIHELHFKGARLKRSG